MHVKAIVLALAATPLVAAHGKVVSATGDKGGNGTALGIMGGVVPGPGPNGKTETDTTQFRSTKIMTNGLGKTTGNGQNKVAMVKTAMAQSGDKLPQVSTDGTGILQGVFHIVTTDGAGPIQAVLDPTATGNFASGIMLTAIKQVPGKGGNIKATQGKNANHKRSLWERSLDVIMKRATNVNEDYPYSFAIPKDTKCTGTMGDLTNVCMVKIANNNRAGPFGGVVMIQAVDGPTAPATVTPTEAAPAPPAKAKRFVA